MRKASCQHKPMSRCLLGHNKLSLAPHIDRFFHILVKFVKAIMLDYDICLGEPVHTRVCIRCFLIEIPTSAFFGLYLFMSEAAQPPSSCQVVVLSVTLLLL